MQNLHLAYSADNAKLSMEVAARNEYRLQAFQNPIIYAT